MANRVLVSMQEGMNEPVWFSRIEEFVKKILEELADEIIWTE